MAMKRIDEILYELERTWEAGSLPGRQACEFNAALRELHRLQQQEPAAVFRGRPRRSIGMPSTSRCSARRIW